MTTEILLLAGLAALALPTIGGAIALTYDVLRAVGDFLLRAIFVTKTTQDDFTAGVLTTYLNRKARSYGVADEHYDASRRYLRPIEKDGVIFFRKLSRSFRLYLYQKAFILLLPGDKAPNSDVFHAASFRFLRWTLDWEKLLIVSAQEYDDHFKKQEERKYSIHRFKGGGGHPGEPPSTESIGKERLSPWGEGDMQPIGWQIDDIGLPPPDEPLNHLSLGPEAMRMVDDVRFWFAHRDWHRDRGLPWRRGYLLYGAPGTGKTSLSRAIAEELDIPIFLFDLASMDNEDFLNSWEVAQQTTPRMVIFEDFDTIFNGRQRTSKDAFLSFDCILNAVDGVERQEGLIFVVTTNLVDTIDPAMGRPDDSDSGSSRPGRIDLAIELPGLSYEGRYKMAVRILKDETAARDLAESTDEVPAAQFQETCAIRAKAMLFGR